MLYLNESGGNMVSSFIQESRSGKWIGANAASANTSEGLQKSVATAHPATATHLSQSNYNIFWLQQAEESIVRLTMLDLDDPYHLDPDAGRRAIEILSFLRHNVLINPPRVLPEGEEDVALTWESDASKRYLSVSLDSVEVMDLIKADRSRTIEQIGDDTHVDLMKLIELLSAQTNSQSSSRF